MGGTYAEYRRWHRGFRPSKAQRVHRRQFWDACPTCRSRTLASTAVRRTKSHRWYDERSHRRVRLKIEPGKWKIVSAAIVIGGALVTRPRGGFDFCDDLPVGHDLRVLCDDPFHVDARPRPSGEPGYEDHVGWPPDVSDERMAEIAARASATARRNRKRQGKDHR